MRPIITIITPTYNHEKFIQKCIESVLNQTFDSWEMVIVDDASGDATFDIARRYAENDSRIRIIRHSRNWGIGKLVSTYNQALNTCRTKYIAILEGDDFWPKDKLEKQVNHIQKRDVVFSFGNCILTGEDGVPIKLFTYNYEKRLISNRPIGAVLKLFATLNFSIIPVTVVIRRKDLVSIGGFQKDQYYPFADIPTFLKLALKGKFSYQDDILGYYRKQSNSEWFNFASNTSAMGREEVAKCVNNFIKRNANNYFAARLAKEKAIIAEQSRFVIKKKTGRKLSILINKIAFKIKLNPLVIAFGIDYLLYKIKKIVSRVFN